MPIYEYRCSDCGFQKEFLQKVSDARLTTCTSCGKETFQKMLTAAGFQLKGSGWYATDFKNSGSKPAEKSDDAAKNGKEAVGADAAKTDTAKSDSSKSDSGSDSGTKSTESSTSAASTSKSDSGSGTSSTSSSSSSTKSSAPV